MLKSFPMSQAVYKIICYPNFICSHPHSTGAIHVSSYNQDLREYCPSTNCQVLCFQEKKHRKPKLRTTVLRKFLLSFFLFKLPQYSKKLYLLSFFGQYCRKTATRKTEIITEPQYCGNSALSGLPWVRTPSLPHNFRSTAEVSIVAWVGCSH